MSEKIAAISLPVLNQAGEKISKISLSGEVFGIEPNKQVMFDAVNTYRANRRQATAMTKTRDEVSGGGKKPWKQKGTGKARAGSSRSPIWVGGGTVFGPRGTQNYKLSMNKGAHKLALRSALSTKVAAGEIIVVNDINLPEIKTKALVEVLGKINAKTKSLIVIDENENVMISARNINTILVVASNNVSVYDLLNADSVVATEAAVKKIEGGLL